MPNVISTTQYVKFVRGTPTAFANLTNKNPDTLYFIAENNANTGKLYLGSKLISGGSSSISELGNIIISSLGDKQILVYDETQSAWVNSDIQNIIGIMRGATAQANGFSGLVPAPKAGEQDKFLKGDGTWGSPEIAVDSKVLEKNANNELTLKGIGNTQVGNLLQVSSTGGVQWVDPGTLQTDLTEVNDAISDLQAVLGTLISTKVEREIVDDISDIDLTKDNVIYMVPDGASSGNLYNEYMVINGEIELIGSNYEGDLSGYVTSVQFNTTVGDLNTSISNVSSRLQTVEGNYVSLSKYNTEVGDLTQLLLSQTNGNTLVDQVNDLTDRLTWYLIQ